MNVVLIGMSGVGKSTLGVLASKALGMDFVDTDICIQNAKGRLLQNIINKDGIDYFLRLEEKVILELNRDNCVISTGGSVVYSRKVMMHLKQNNNKVIYPYLPYEEIEKRIKNITTRGIVMRYGKNLKDTYKERIPLYDKYSDVIIDCTDKGIEQCVNEIIQSI